MNIVQLRSTIFLPQNIGYTPENEERFKNMIMPTAKVYGIMPQGIPMLGVNPNLPQFGMPWRLFWKTENHEEYNVAFHPGKIDIILTKEFPYGNSEEVSFCNKCSELFSKILGAFSNINVTRIAYAPLYAIKRDSVLNNSIWNNLLNISLFENKNPRDINFSFLFKKIINIENKEIEINLLHNLFDGNQIKNNGRIQEVIDVLLFQLDFNSVPETMLSLGDTGIREFFKDIIQIKNDLVKNVIK